MDVSVLFGEELAGRDHQIDWILQSEAHCARSYITEWGGGRVWVGATDLGGSLVRRIHKHAQSILHDLKIFRQARSRSYDVIQVKDKFIAGLFAAVAARVFGTRFVYWLSWPFPEDSLTQALDGSARYPLLYFIRGHIFKFVLYRILMRAADHVFVQSEQMRRDIEAEGVPRWKMTAVPMGIKSSGFASKSRSYERKLIPQGEKCFLYLGTLTHLRRLDFLVRVLARVREKVPDARLYFVGQGADPKDERLLMAEGSRLQVTDAMIFTGQLPWAEALKYVAEANVCVSPFYPIPILNSTSPTKLVEYMAMGRPVVANDHPEQRLLIEESHAGFCVPWDEGHFADAIVRLLKDPQLAEEMGGRGPEYVARHRDYKIIADLVESQLLKVVGRSLT